MGVVAEDSPMTSKTFNPKTAPGHQVLAAAGKTILRPGGQAASQRLWTWADFSPGDTVLELASSFGVSAIALAQRFGVNVVGVEQNPESVQRAREAVREAGGWAIAFAFLKPVFLISISLRSSLMGYWLRQF